MDPAVLEEFNQHSSTHTRSSTSPGILDGIAPSSCKSTCKSRVHAFVLHIQCDSGVGIAVACIGLQGSIWGPRTASDSGVVVVDTKLRILSRFPLFGVSPN